MSLTLPVSRVLISERCLIISQFVLPALSHATQPSQPPPGLFGPEPQHACSRQVLDATRAARTQELAQLKAEGAAFAAEHVGAVALVREEAQRELDVAAAAAAKEVNVLFAPGSKAAAEHWGVDACFVPAA